MKHKSPKMPSTLTYVSVFIVVIVAVLGGVFGYQKYQDVQNNQLIESIAEDFPALIAGVESAVEYPLTISSDCLQTQEKFSEGVALCNIVGYTDIEDGATTLEKYNSYLAENQIFKQGENYRSGSGYIHYYKNIECKFNYTESVRLDCAFGVRDANKLLASELLNEEKLNNRKNELLNQ